VVTGYNDIIHASLTDVGVRRSHNQDNLAVLLATDEVHWRTQGHLFLVADGMGGHAVGELASSLAVGIIPHTYGKYADQGAAAALRKAFLEANASIYARGQQNPEFMEMGTTTTALVLRPEGVWVGHVGDSRAYRIRDGQIEQLSFDHSHVWDIARQLRVDPDRVQGIPSNLLLRSLGPQPLVQIDIEGPHPLRHGDVYVLCSDGLTGQVTDAELGAVVSTLPPAEACQFLVDLANLRGGPDNITLLIVRVGEGDLASSDGLAVPAARPGLLSRIPWHLVNLLLGTLLAAGGIALVLSAQTGFALPAFLLAALVIGVGMIGLGRHYAHEKRRAEQEADLPPLQIHRRTPCRIERPLVDRLAGAVQSLKQRLHDRQWDAEWPAFGQHLAEAEKHLAANELAVAFRAYCRAMRVLTEALKQYRQKEEVFQPVWPKASAGTSEEMDDDEQFHRPL
jgi:protein phosphatase